MLKKIQQSAFECVIIMTDDRIKRKTNSMLKIENDNFLFSNKTTKEQPLKVVVFMIKTKIQTTMYVKNKVMKISIEIRCLYHFAM